MEIYLEILSAKEYLILVQLDLVKQLLSGAYRAQHCTNQIY